MRCATRRNQVQPAGMPVGLIEYVLGVPAVRPGIVDSAQRRLALGPLPPARLLAASVVDVLLAGRHRP